MQAYKACAAVYIVFYDSYIGDLTWITFRDVIYGWLRYTVIDLLCFPPNCQRKRMGGWEGLRCSCSYLLKLLKRWWTPWVFPNFEWGTRSHIVLTWNLIEWINHFTLINTLKVNNTPYSMLLSSNFYYCHYLALISLKWHVRLILSHNSP